MSFDDQEDNNHAPPPEKRRKLSCIGVSNVCSDLGEKNNAQLDNVTFIVGTAKERITGNRTIFASQSQVFRAMLFGNMMETEVKSNETIISDVTEAAFTFLKNIFDKNKASLNTDIVCDVIYACKQYLLNDLECKCYKFIENISNLDNWWKLIQVQTAITVNDINMQYALIEKSKILMENSETILASADKLVNIVPEWLCQIVSSSSFVISREEKVWEMCLEYCKNRFGKSTSLISPKRGMNDYFLTVIRFPLISKDYLKSKIEPTGILTVEVLNEISKCLDKTDNNCKDKHKYNPKYNWKCYPRKAYYEKPNSNDRIYKSQDKINIRPESKDINENSSKNKTKVKLISNSKSKSESVASNNEESKDSKPSTLIHGKLTNKIKRIINNELNKVTDTSWLSESERSRILSRCVEKIEKAYDDRMEKHRDSKLTWRIFWNVVEPKAINLVAKYFDREMKIQENYRKRQRDKNKNGKNNTINQNNTAN